ncbi:YceI family protein [Litoribaculum gwangyangense]|uniref:Lipid/polyisoprenoid-binding YceI-like domain-containing protein n=1 Tax=Litoribaculum gwangyangense TaxID=1130722 RepID=A0ABP9CYI9_9FLAO
MKMKKLVIFGLLIFSLNIFSQTKFLTKTGIVNFEASVPSFEEVKAKNEAVTAILNTENGEFAALILVKGFRFKNALMEEHFNENYAESDTYPKATFKGKINNFSLEALKTISDFKITGELNFHGKTKKIEVFDLKVTKTDDTVSLIGNFKTNTSDFDIKIPKIVQNKVSESVNVWFAFNLTSK